MSTSASVVHDAVIRMGHDIARQFNHLPHHQAVQEISAHILKFWEPRMRTELRRCVANDDHDLEPLLTQAVHTWPDEHHTQADRHDPSGG